VIFIISLHKRFKCAKTCDLCSLPEYEIYLNQRDEETKCNPAEEFTLKCSHFCSFDGSQAQCECKTGYSVSCRQIILFLEEFFEYFEKFEFKFLTSRI